MFTSIDKALVALIMAIVYFAAQLGLVPADFISEAMVQNIVMVLAPALVWLIPNKQ